MNRNIAKERLLKDSSFQRNSLRVCFLKSPAEEVQLGGCAGSPNHTTAAASQTKEARGCGEVGGYPKADNEHRLHARFLFSILGTALYSWFPGLDNNNDNNKKESEHGPPRYSCAGW